MSVVPELAQDFLDACKRKGILATTAESCTGGQIIALLTDIPGASKMVDCGFVTYSNDAKQTMLGVSPATLDAHGAVSAQTAREMAEGALANSKANIALAVTGIAGPDGGTEEKPVGLVFFAVAVKGQPTRVEKREFEDNGRDHIRNETVRTALVMGISALG
ncbi:nicotinamide-nucleotide amidohydrolase family protein [Aliihoeflea aestuarii]|uniref:CinA family protein n=1 Tax=Aliihoeflea aestuarii TaxID=453840 RepID=UPI0020925516|nr:CinA family protein [Aliihoeflea aestuarii]MCO6390662.1 nicotinamide-nucleotide amidohydrolase family protein [Aliihoeflea aestuarii]